MFDGLVLAVISFHDFHVDVAYRNIPTKPTHLFSDATETDTAVPLSQTPASICRFLEEPFRDGNTLVALSYSVTHDHASLIRESRIVSSQPTEAT